MAMDSKNHEQKIEETDNIIQENPQKAIVLHSGGIDSTTCLGLAIRTYGVEHVLPISIFYGQQHDMELHAAREVAFEMGILKVEQLDLSSLKLDSALIKGSSKEIPDVSYNDIQGVSPAYVPFRNGLFLSAVTAIAVGRGYSAVIYGAHAEDARNWAYPDCTPEFIGAMSNAIFIGTYYKVRLVTPLQWMTKVSIIRTAYEMGISLRNTWSCYKGLSHHCGICPTCRARREGFLKAAITDPTTYLE